jgi:hypothetical protein
MKKSYLWITVGIFVAALCCSVSAQDRSGGRGGRPGMGGTRLGHGRLPSPEFDKATFDMTRQQLPPLYIGHDIRALYDALQSRNPGKDGAIDAALRKEPSLQVTSAPAMDQVYAFEVRPAVDSIKASKQIVSASAELSAVLAGQTESPKKGIRIVYAPEIDNQYTITNPNGSKVVFKELKFTDYVLALTNFDEFAGIKTVSSLSRTAVPGKDSGQILGETPKAEVTDRAVQGAFRVRETEVEQFKESIRLLALCRLAAPYTTSRIVHRQGTSDNPEEYLADHRHLHVCLLELWFYDIITGRIVLKMQPATSRL